MKGIVFTEFLEMVEQEFGVATADAMVVASDLSSGGAYTAVGSYDHQEILRMVENLSQSTGIAAAQLARAFGRYLFRRFSRLYPHFYEGVGDAFSMLARIDSYIHIEVRKLYDDAELPRVSYTPLDDGGVQLTYRSARPFADVAEGLIEGCIEHYGEGEAVRVQRLAQDDLNNRHAIFVLTRVSHPQPEPHTNAKAEPV